MDGVRACVPRNPWAFDGYLWEVRVDHNPCIPLAFVSNLCSIPSDRPSIRPSDRPSDRPTVRPSDRPSVRPSDRPTVRLSDRPTVRPSDRPTVRPYDRPSDRSIVRPSDRPTELFEIFKVEFRCFRWTLQTRIWWVSRSGFE